MIKILSHLEFTRVGHYQSILEQQGIRCTVRNANTSSIMGEVPYTEVWPELWILNDADEKAALAVLAEYATAIQNPIPPWTCPQCQTQVEEGFGECWNCGTAKPG